MVKQITIKENNDTLLMYDLGQVLQIIHNGVMFNIDKNKLMKILNEETKTFVEIKKEHNNEKDD